MALVADEPERYAGVAAASWRQPSPPRRDGRDAARIPRIQGRLGHPLRPALRDRAAAPAQARQMGRPGHPHLHQSRSLRRLRRLRARLQLHGDRAAGDRIRAQAAHQSIELQQGFLLRRGLLPELRDRSRRTLAQARGDGAVEPAICRRSPSRSCPRSASASASWSPASAAPASSPSARRSPSPPISTGSSAPISI